MRGKMRGRLWAVIAVGVAVSVAAPAGATSVTNGDFSAGLTGWTASGPVADGGGFALLYDDLASVQASLSQQILIPAGAKSLSFDYLLGFTPDGTSGYPIPDFFTARLLNPVTLDPLLATPGYTDYFYHDAGGLIDFDPNIVSKTGNTVELDLTSLPANTDALLSFDLFIGDDGRTTQVQVDNVTLQQAGGVIPEPLTAVGIPLALAGLAGYLRRRRLGRD